jgi:hypothetical protein
MQTAHNIDEFNMVRAERSPVSSNNTRATRVSPETKY